MKPLFQRGRAISPSLAAGGVALWLLAVNNLGFWRTYIGAQSPGPQAWLAGLGLALALWLMAGSLLRALAWGRLTKPLWALLLISAAFAAHFIDGWGVLIDKAMLRNVIETDVREASDLVTWRLAADVLLRGLLPVLLLAWLPLRPVPLRGQLRAIAAWLLTMVLGLALVLSSFYPVYASTFRNHRELRLQLVPSNYLGALWSLYRPRSQPVFQTVAADAVRAPRERPRLVVLVVGETARADNFSLGGYARPTNTPLDGWPLTWFANVSSCGTDTATSLPCMFSDLGERRFSVEAAARRDNLLDVLARSGVAVQWLENNSGCKGVCARVPTVSLAEQQGCPGGQCHDDRFVQGLQRNWPARGQDALLVLHQQGSHGPAYFKRYPGEGPFQPVCSSLRLQDCDPAHVVNAYDNSIHFSSQALAELLGELARKSAAEPERDVLMLYVSDHGESLGERGVFLHGMPKLLAPHEQSHVPMLLWMAPGSAARLAPDAACLQRVAQQPASHDNLFHTLLGLFGVQTQAYRADLDVLAAAQGRQACPQIVPKPVHANG